MKNKVLDAVISGICAAGGAILVMLLFKNC